MNRSLDERKFFEATGLDLNRLVARHLGKESESQIFEWIGIVLGHQYFEAPAGSMCINTLEGWYQYLKDSGLHEAFKEVAGGKISDVPDK